MENVKIKYSIYIICVSFALLSLCLSLINTGYSRNFFYFAVYLSAIGLFIERKSITANMENIAWTISLLGIVKLCWFFIYYGNSLHYDFYNSQFSSGKKLLLGGILIFYMTQFSAYVNKKYFARYVLYILTATLILAAFYGLVQFIQGTKRVTMSLNRATMTAYIYSGLSILLMCFLFCLNIKNKKNVLLILIIFCISYSVIFLVGTRSVIIMYPVILLISLLLFYSKKDIKMALSLCVVTVIMILFFYNSFLKNNINQTIFELTTYDQQAEYDNNSLGTRFSMWKIGIELFMEHPYGSSLEQRFQAINDLTQKKNAYQVVLNTVPNSHFHNELIESASLQGIAGILSVLIIYLSIFINALKSKNTALFAVGCCIMVYGFTDVLFISAEAVLFYMLAIALSSVIWAPVSKITA